MKILLLGEYSGFYYNLKVGLESLGHIVKLYADGDYWKKIPGADDRLLSTNYDESAMKKLHEYIFKSNKFLNKFKNYDVVQMVNPLIFNPLFNMKIVSEIAKNNKKLFISAAGYDLMLVNAYKSGIFDYYMFDNNEREMKAYDIFSRYGLINRHNEQKIINLADGVIPVSYEYSIAYKTKINKCRVIPLPIDCNNTKMLKNKIENKIIIFHGLNREDAKGSKYIREAMMIIRDRYSDKVECIIDGKMPLAEYEKLLNKSNIVIDQCKSYGYGMNALIAMAKGKVVLSGCEPEALEEYGIEDCPVINIKPQTNNIVEKLEKLINNPESITEIGYKSRKFTEEFHDSKIIAQQYIDVWNSVGEEII